MNLQQAITLLTIGLHKGDGVISMIEYEDGSGDKFNYRLHNESSPRFIDLKIYNQWVEGDNSKETLIYLIEHSTGYNHEMYITTLQLRHNITYQAA